MKLDTALGNEMRKAFDKSGYTLGFVAGEAGVDRATLNKVLNGDTSTRMVNYHDVAQVLGKKLVIRVKRV